jgi:hypothetical protein
MEATGLRQKYLKLLPKLNDIVEQVEQKLSSLPADDFQYEVAIKPFDSLKHKLEHRHLDNPLELSDLVRGRLFFSNKLNFDDAIKQVKNLFKDQIINIKAKKEKDNGFEYFGVAHCDMCIDGIRFELQIMTAEHRPFLPMLHYCYEQHRYDKPSIGGMNALRKINNGIYEHLKDLYYRLRK